MKNRAQYVKMHNIECQNHKTVHLERQTGWTRDLQEKQLVGLSANRTCLAHICAKQSSKPQP